MSEGNDVYEKKKGQNGSAVNFSALLGRRGGMIDKYDLAARDDARRIIIGYPLHVRSQVWNIFCERLILLMARRMVSTTTYCFIRSRINLLSEYNLRRRLLHYYTIFVAFVPWPSREADDTRGHAVLTSSGEL